MLWCPIELLMSFTFLPSTDGFVLNWPVEVDLSRDFLGFDISWGASDRDYVTSPRFKKTFDGFFACFLIFFMLNLCALLSDWMFVIFTSRIHLLPVSWFWKAPRFGKSAKFFSHSILINFLNNIWHSVGQFGLAARKKHLWLFSYS